MEALATRSSRVRLPAALMLLAGMATVWPAGNAAAGDWLAPGDAGLRDDLQRLVDESVLDLPLMAWPVHADNLRAALDAIPEDLALSAGQQSALERVRRMLARQGELRLRAGGTNTPAPVRSFDDGPREEGELGIEAGWSSGRWSAQLDLTVVTDPADHQTVRPDGTYVEGLFGNWSVTAGYLERWWGPGWEGSLLLGTAARPVPALSIDRAMTTPFESKWLRWIGPWTVNAFMGAMENERQDRDHPLLMGLRVAARPLDGLEIAFERTAQWCAEGLPCNAQAFWDVLTGQDNQGINVDVEDEPGNQLAGWSARWASPIGSWPYAFYAQSIGEAAGQSTIPWPVQRLRLQGMEIWGGREGGVPWRLYYEWADTQCQVSDERFPDCAYNNGLFFVEGYRFRGQPVGHGVDGDGRIHSLGLQLREAAGADWRFLVRYLEINRVGAVPDTSHTLSPEPLDMWEAQARVDFDWLGGRFALGIAGEQREPLSGDDETEGRFFATFTYPF